jgi:hypothetical protein
MNQEIKAANPHNITKGSNAKEFAKLSSKIEKLT